MRATVGCLACLAAMTSVALAAPQAVPADNSTSTHSPATYYLSGYYKIDNQRPVWQNSDDSPWTEVSKNEPWVNRRIVSKWGYIPFTHDSKNYYCQIDNGPRTGSHVSDVTFMCGDPATVQWLFSYDQKPNIPLIGGGPELSSSLRPRPSNAN